MCRQAADEHVTTHAPATPTGGDRALRMSCRLASHGPVRLWPRARFKARVHILISHFPLGFLLDIQISYVFNSNLIESVSNLGI
jgi:hypothetical protein